MATPVMFGRFIVTSHVFYTTPLSLAFVNIKPLLPGHVLVIPRRIVPRLIDLTSEEATDFILTIQKVGRMVERVYNATALNVAMQDGPDAGQSVPHVHMHIIPRRRTDMDSRGGNDAIYGMIEGEEGDVGKQLREKYDGGKVAEGEESFAARPKMPKIDEADRKERSDEDMAAEAKMLAGEMDREKL